MYCTVHKNKQTLDCAEDHEPDPSGFEILCCVGVYRKRVFKTVNYTPDEVLYFKKSKFGFNIFALFATASGLF